MDALNGISSTTSTIGASTHLERPRATDTGTDDTAIEPEKADSHSTKEETYELQNVHEIYNQIADHFSSTRHKPWPLIASFLQSLTPGSIGLDVGCGNGKYLSVPNQGIFILGSDRSDALVEIARGQSGNFEVCVADCLALPHREGQVDFVISVAVIHHLSTAERRVEAVRTILECLTPGGDGRGRGRALIYVWALEQASSRRGWKEGDEQDVLVPWVKRSVHSKPAPFKLSADAAVNAAKADEDGDEQGGDQVFHRYYHLYAKGELERDVVAAGGVVLEAGYERDNWWVIATRGG